MSICAALIPTQAWIHKYIAQPFQEGGERLKRAWHGVDFRLFFQPPISLKDRIIYGIIGFILTIPLLSSITWIFMQIFSEPERFA